MESKLINKDKLWNKIKNYIYLVLFLFGLLSILLIICIILNCYIIKSIKYPIYTTA